MDLETVVKIEGYSVKYQQENDRGQAQSDEIKSGASITQVRLLPGPCSFQNYDSTSPTAIAFHPEIVSASNCKRIINAAESPLTITKDVKEEALAEETFRCSIPNCSKSFVNKQKRSIHLKYEHRENWFKCHLCESAFPIEFVLKNHLATHSIAQPYVCNVCSRLCENIQDLRKHEREHQMTNKVTQNSGSEQQPPLQCSESAKIVMLKLTPISIILPTISSSFSLGAAPAASRDVVLRSRSPTEKSSSELGSHECDPLKQTQIVLKNRRKEEASAEKKYENCYIPNCAKSFANKWKLHTHLKIKHGQNWSFKCQLCGRLCSNKSDLESHLVSHSTARPNNCNVCSKSFKYIKHLREHEREVHQIIQQAPQKSRLEKQLPFQLQRPKSAKIVMRRKTPIPILPKTPFPASLGAVPFGDVLPCSKPSTAVLKVNPTHKCDVCWKTFKSQNALTCHRRHVHTAENEKKHKCHICHLSCVNRSTLKIHLYFVHGEKSDNLKILECEFCQQEFPSVSRLEAHVVDKHVVDKEFECSVCSKTFVDQGALTKHQVQFHEQKIKNNFCDVCSAGFTRIKDLGSHLKNVHKKLYCCKCLSSFENKSQYNQHLNSEAGNNLEAGLKLKCQVCFVSLSTQCYFKMHTDGHLREEKSTVVT